MLPQDVNLKKHWQIFFGYRKLFSQILIKNSNPLLGSEERTIFTLCQDFHS